jgi:hypothetical protein
MRQAEAAALPHIGPSRLHPLLPFRRSNSLLAEAKREAAMEMVDLGIAGGGGGKGRVLGMLVAVDAEGGGELLLFMLEVLSSILTFFVFRSKLHFTTKVPVRCYGHQNIYNVIHKSFNKQIVRK